MGWSVQNFKIFASAKKQLHAPLLYPEGSWRLVMLYVTGRWSGYLACNQSILPSGYKVISEVARNRIPIVQPADSPCFETMILKILSYFVEIFPRKLNFCKKKHCVRLQKSIDFWSELAPSGYDVACCACARITIGLVGNPQTSDGRSYWPNKLVFRCQSCSSVRP